MKYYVSSLQKLTETKKNYTRCKSSRMNIENANLNKLVEELVDECYIHIPGRGRNAHNYEHNNALTKQHIHNAAGQHRSMHLIEQNIELKLLPERLSATT